MRTPTEGEQDQKVDGRCANHCCTIELLGGSILRLAALGSVYQQHRPEADIASFSRSAGLNAQLGKIDFASPIWADAIREIRDRHNLF